MTKGLDAALVELMGNAGLHPNGKMMPAIVVAGRSGAAIAAELGTMRVSEEVDALRTMGFCPLRHLVFPRVLALVIVLPLLTLLADVVGIAGVLLISTTQLDVTDVFGGVLKAGVFGAIIGLAACERGLGARGGAEGVGRATTSAVVSILFYIVLTDALFSVLFDLYGL